ncbi:MAG: helix-turn-helix domain-containing protein [Candidatus Omnitrophica bacterium]|nr:helix-turn-helix domain-containing protein [Candidatus Omnitrophota bacterium]
MQSALIDKNKIAEYLGVKPSTIYAWVNQKRLPYIKVGRLLKFDIRDIDAWIQEHKVEEYGKQ